MIANLHSILCDIIISIVFTCPVYSDDNIVFDKFRATDAQSFVKSWE